jgi:hypothetical protein
MHLLASVCAFYDTNCSCIIHVRWSKESLLEVGNRIALFLSHEFATLLQCFLLYLTPGLVDAPTCFRLRLLQQQLRAH